MKRILMFASKVQTRSNNKTALDLTSYSDVAIWINTEKAKNNRVRILVGHEDIASYDLVYFRTWRKYEKLATSIARYLKSQAIPCIDTEIMITQPDSKTYEYVVCALNNIPVPQSLIGHVKKIVKMQKDIESEFTYPLIVKAAESRQGKDNFLVYNFKDLKDAIRHYPADTTFIIQKFIPNSFDYRFVVTGYKTSLVYQRVRNPKSDSHLNNVSKGGLRRTVKQSDVKDLCKIAEKASKLFHREISGVDIVVDNQTKKPYILEVNSAPQLQYAPALRAVKKYLSNI